MKKTLKLMILGTMASALIGTALPAIGVTAQEESSQETSSEVETSTSESATDEATTDSTEEFPFDVVVNEASVDSQTFLDAYEAFKTITQDYQFQDMMSSESNGIAMDEFLADFSIDIEPTVEELSENEATASYVFGSEEEGDQVELLVQFINDRLVYAGVADTSVQIEEGSENTLIEESVVEDWIFSEEYTDVTTVAESNPSIIGISHMNFTGYDYDTLMIPTGSGVDDMFVDFVIFEDQLVMNSLPEDIEVASDNPNARMMSYTVGYIDFLIQETTESGEEVSSEE